MIDPLLARVRPLHSAKLRIALIKHGVDPLEESVAQNVECHITSRLDASVTHAVACIGESVWWRETRMSVPLDQIRKHDLTLTIKYLYEI